MISLVTNAAIGDEVRIRYTIASWLRVFDSELAEVVIVLDTTPASGRIAQLQGSHGSSDALMLEVGKLERSDRRVRHMVLPAVEQLGPIAHKWFKHGRPMRCQAGTPILAFIYAIEAGKERVVVRADCDMLFWEKGWVWNARELIESNRVDLVEPPRLGTEGPTNLLPVSTRALMLEPSRFRRKCLPMKAHTLGVFRRVHRFLKGRPPWMALEQMLQKEKEKNRLRHLVLDSRLGFSIHVANRKDAMWPGFENVVRQVERGIVPEGQAGKADFDVAAWTAGAGVAEVLGGGFNS